ncbi:hypothetical protein CY34DRAFT_806509 [Suillus luteus UH-Slu-Lm8-n1]|uniref:Uncharacterized protein n=1 Tax=Suillus luteus UH-Slu-Lm8-n1 TaxID=930992 RepID=A0A0D0B3J1_9AGAM|nr:hypothetical protein CY34DRAFT_806509 [Suillus luteus UH-Slu-Lm8-n1]
MTRLFGTTLASSPAFIHSPSRDEQIQTTSLIWKSPVHGHIYRLLPPQFYALTDNPLRHLPFIMSRAFCSIIWLSFDRKGRIDWLRKSSTSLSDK